MDYNKSRELESHPLVKALWARWNQTLEIFQGMASAAPLYERCNCPGTGEIQHERWCSSRGKYYVSTYGLDAVGWCIEEVKKWLVEQENNKE